MGETEVGSSKKGIQVKSSRNVNTNRKEGRENRKAAIGEKNKKKKRKKSRSKSD